METVRLVHRGSRIMSPLIPSILGLAVLVLAACSTAARGIFKKCVNSQAVYLLSEQHGLEAQERR